MQKIKEILEKNRIFEYSVCEFEFVRQGLLNCRAKARLPENSKSIIMAAFPYKVREAPPENISRYAAVPDYHIVCGNILNGAANDLKKLYPQNNFEVFLDNSPIPEVAAGVHSGLGVLGKNGLLINGKYGSFVFIGEIVTDLELHATKGGKKCLDCGQCSSACSSILNKEDCLSAVNQRKQELSDSQIKRIAESGCCFGCDKCSEVCPMNKNKELTYIKEFVDGYRNEYVLGEASTDRAYNWRGKVIERNYKIICERR